MPNKYEDIISAEQRIIDGDIYTPVDVKGTAYRRVVMNKLEELRVSMAALADESREKDVKHRTAVASVTHDLKTPLAIISGYAECLQDGIGDKDYAALILSKVEEMNGMIQGLVETSRQELMEMPSIERVSARAYFKPLFERLRPAAERKNIKFRIGPVPKADIMIDAVNTERVFQNLISNAIKYTDEKGRIDVLFRRRGSFLAVAVRDSGRGISKAALPNIFDKFYMEDASRSSRQSSGLGLYIAKDILEKSGGRISAKSKLGKGSTFTVLLPVKRDVKDVSDSAASKALSRFGRVVLLFCFGMIIAFPYRMIRFFETGSAYALGGALLAIPLFPVFWIADIVTTALTGRIMLLAD